MRCRCASILIWCLSLVGCKAGHEESAEKHAKPDGWPILEILSVALPQEATKPMEIKFKISVSGKTPIAICQSNFVTKLEARDLNSFYWGVLDFPTNTPKIVIARPGKPLVITATSVYASRGGHLKWRDIPPNEYLLFIGVGSGKSRMFDYEFLGGANSNKIHWHPSKN